MLQYVLNVKSRVLNVMGRGVDVVEQAWREATRSRYGIFHQIWALTLWIHTRRSECHQTLWCVRGRFFSYLFDFDYDHYTRVTNAPLHTIGDGNETSMRGHCSVCVQGAVVSAPDPWSLRYAVNRVNRKNRRVRKRRRSDDSKGLVTFASTGVYPDRMRRERKHA